MNKLVRLGDSIKRDYPQYKDVSSEEIGIAILAKARQERLYHNADIVDLLNAVVDKVEVDRGSISAWFAKVRERGNRRVNQQLVKEMEVVRMMLAERHLLEEQQYQYSILPEKRMEEEEVRRGTHEAIVEKIKFDRQLEKTAADKGRDLTTHTQITFLEALSKIEVNKERKLTDIKFKDHERKEYLELEKKIKLDKKELKKRWKEIEQDLKAGFIYQMQGYQHLQLMTEYINGLYKQVALAGNDRTKALLEEHIEFMEAQFRGKQRLLQVADGQEPEGTETTDEPSDPR